MNNYTQKEHLTLVELLQDESLGLCFTPKSSDEKLFFRNNENEYFSVPHKTHFKGSEIEKMDSLIGFEEKNSKDTLDYLDSWLNYCRDYPPIDMDIDEESNTTRKEVVNETDLELNLMLNRAIDEAMIRKEFRIICDDNLPIIKENSNHIMICDNCSKFIDYNQNEVYHASGIFKNIEFGNVHLCLKCYRKYFGELRELKLAVKPIQ